MLCGRHAARVFLYLSLLSSCSHIITGKDGRILQNGIYREEDFSIVFHPETNIEPNLVQVYATVMRDLADVRGLQRTPTQNQQRPTYCTAIQQFKTASDLNKTPLYIATTVFCF